MIFKALVLGGMFMSMLGGAMAQAETIEAIEMQVAAIEQAFADTMAKRDFTAFASFIDDDAVFWGNEGALRGKDSVLKAWKPYFEADAAPFAWKPETIMALPSGDLAHSTGPVWTADGTVVAHYHSTWRKGEDGQWKIIFDKGQAVCTHID